MGTATTIFELFVMKYTSCEGRSRFRKSLGLFGSEDAARRHSEGYESDLKVGSYWYEYPTDSEGHFCFVVEPRAVIA